MEDLLRVSQVSFYVDDVVQNYKGWVVSESYADALEDNLLEVTEERDRLLEVIRAIDRENFILAAGQCVVGDGIVMDDHGHGICPKEVHYTKEDKE